MSQNIWFGRHSSRAWSWRIALAILAVAGAAGCEPENGADGTSCSVDDNGDGSYTLHCDDGTSVTVHDGVDPDPCTSVDNGDGTATITCGTSEVVVHDGSSCTVTDNGDGTYDLDCGGGASVVVSDGEDGTDCTVDDNGDGSYTLSCEDGTTVVFSDGVDGDAGVGCTVTDNMDGSYTLTCGTTDVTFWGPPADPVRLLGPGKWMPAVRTALNDMLADYGVANPAYDPADRPIAVFDWDNIVIKNDIGDATFFWSLRHDVIKAPPDLDGDTTSDWEATSPRTLAGGAVGTYLSAAAIAALDAACGGLVAPGQPLPTSTNTACADEIFTIYYDGTTTGATPRPAAWAIDTLSPEHTTTLNAPYAWVAQLLSGYRPAEIRAFAESAFYENADNPEGTTQTIGTRSGVTHWLRVYDEMRDLIGALRDNGFDVWVVSASPQYVVEAAAADLGITRDRIIGIRQLLDASGRLTSDLDHCGIPDPSLPHTDIITYYWGKHCWINKVIFGVPLTDPLHPTENPQLERPADVVLVAGDSPTDLGMLWDAEAVRLVINRRKTELMCHAYANVTGNWYVQPMFIRPGTCATTPFACDTALDPDGDPIRDELGAPIPPQTDTVCTLP